MRAFVRQSILTVALFLSSCIGQPAFADVPPEVRLRQEQMLDPSVMIAFDDDVHGSGTIIYSADQGDGHIETYVLTAQHVVVNTLKTTPNEQITGLAAIRNEKGQRIGYAMHRLYLVDADEKRDLALLKFADTEHLYPTAPLEVNADVYPAEEIFAVGAPKGLTTVITSGLVADENYQRGPRPHILATAPIWAGNSGGGLFHRGRGGNYELIGMVRAVQSDFAFDGMIIPHLGYSLPAWFIAPYLQEIGLGRILEQPVF